MNIWVPQGPEARAEALELMAVHKCIMSSSTSRPGIGIIQNGITSAFILTDPDNILVPDSIWDSCIQRITVTKDLPSLEDRCRQFGVPARSGAALFSALLPADFTYNSGQVVITNGILRSGRITKGHLGPASRSIIHFMVKYYRYDRTGKFITDATWLLNTYITLRGFTVTYRDCVVDDTTVVDDAIEEARFQVEVLMDGYDTKTQAEKNYVERQIKSKIDNIGAVGVKLAEISLSPNNPMAIMSDKIGSGAKGNTVNIAQITGVVGQQYILGSRIAPLITEGTRTYPGYEMNDVRPEARGYIPESYTKGLGQISMANADTAVRENIANIAVSTAENGDLGRKLNKVGEPIHIAVDGSVTNTNGNIIQYFYGAGFDTSELIQVDTPGQRSMSHFADPKALAIKLNSNAGWYKNTSKAGSSKIRKMPILNY